MLPSTQKSIFRTLFQCAKVTRSSVLTTALRVAAVCSLFAANMIYAAPGYRLLGQPTLADTTLNTRCANANARFNFSNAGGFDMHGPSGIAVDPRGRPYVTDYGGQRVLTWPDFTALGNCAPADGVIGAGELAGPESVAIDARTGTVFVADTLSHTVKGYRQAAGGAWNLQFTLGTQGISGSNFNQSTLYRTV